MSVPDTFKPYPAGAKEEVWTSAKDKSDNIRNQVKTDVGQSLRVAERAYYMIKPNLIDVARLKKAKGPFKDAAALESARRKAQDHFDTVVTPALTALQTAKTKATAAGRNVILTKSVNATAKGIAAALDEPIRVLQSIHLDDFEGEKERLMQG